MLYRRNCTRIPRIPPLLESLSAMIYIYILYNTLFIVSLLGRDLIVLSFCEKPGILDGWCSGSSEVINPSFVTLIYICYIIY